MTQDIKVVSPGNLAEALQILENDPGVTPIAGGTELVGAVRSGKRRPGVFLDLDHLGLDRISLRENEVELGAMMTMSQVIACEQLKGAPWSLLPRALSQIASWQIRNVATIGGSLAGGIPGLDGTSALLALNAGVKLQSTRGACVIPLSDFFLGPMRTRCGAGELITALVLPKPPAGGQWYTCFRKIGVRKAYAMPIVNMASVLSVQDGVVCSWRLAVGGAAKISLLLNRTAALAVGKPLDAVNLEELENCLQQEIAPSDSLHGSAAYKRILCRNLLREIWEELPAEEARVE